MGAGILKIRQVLDLKLKTIKTPLIKVNRMSKRCELQKEYYKEFGNYKGVGKYSDHYVKWLENEVLALRLYSENFIKNNVALYNVSRQRELLLAFAMRELKEPISDFNKEGFEKIVDDFLTNNCG